MSKSVQSIWRWDGEIGRGKFALIGILLFFVKLNLDRFVAIVGFGKHWTIFSYWFPLDQLTSFNQISPPNQKFLVTMVLLALPFIWIGVTLTSKRLRNAGLPVWLVVLFFVPFLNVLFLAFLCLVPEQEPIESRLTQRHSDLLARILPRGKFGSAAMSLLLILPFGIIMTYLGANVFQTYGLGLFLALPFAMGLGSVLLYCHREPRSLSSCLYVSFLSVALLGVGLIGVALEGVICVLMAAPIAIGLAMFGGLVGHSIQQISSRSATATLSMMFLIVPGLLGVEHGAGLQPHTFQVESQVIINAPPEDVWKSVIAFTEIPPPTEALFRSGIAYPIRAEMHGTGNEAVRRCIFSTGAFVEPIEVWDEPRLLRFSVSENPAPLQELSPYGRLEPAHLHGYFVSHQGQFLLTRLSDGKTLLIGTTWYSNALWPEQYWHYWSDYIIHRIHMRVLQHIQKEVETAVGER